jgi:glycosyltransferase involved in cell wall biosynthesis
MQTKISVVIPTYKRPKLLIQCLKALAVQTLAHKDFEVIVVSDGADEETHLALITWKKDYPLNLTYLQTTTKKGPAAARNMGWTSAKSPLIAFTDDDCIPQRSWLTTYLNAYNADLIAFTGRTHVPMPPSPTDFALNTAGLERAEFITANCACSKSALLKIDGFDERFKLAWREDSDLEFNLMNMNIPIIKLPEAQVVHPVREAPWGVSIKEQKKGIYDALLFKKYPELYRLKIQSQPLWNYYLINALWIILFIAILQNQRQLTGICILLIMLLYGNFIYKRLKPSSKSFSHVLEMFYTSILIPTISVYWRIYGAIKYRVFFI